MRITPSVKHLLIANGIFFVLSIVLPEFKGITGLHYFENSTFEWWQYITNMFMHADFTHLLFNMFALYSFGMVLESYLGTNRFLLFYMICGIGASFVHTGIHWYWVESGVQKLVENGEGYEQVKSLIRESQYFPHWKEYLSASDFDNMMGTYRSIAMGASGAIYGVLVGFAMLNPNAELFLLFVPIPIKAKYFIPILLVMDLLSGFTGFSVFGKNIAHFAHLGGALMGFLLMIYFRKTSFKNNRWA